MAKLEALNPANQSFQYFLNIDKWWRPLSNFLFDKCPSLFRQGEAKSWQSIEGHTVNKRLALQIADRLERFLEDGSVERYEDEILITYPPYRCGYCGGKGVYPDGRECIACHGSGEAGVLCFTKENVRAFIEFSRNSGDFDVYSR